MLRECGVFVMTVSRVINNPEKVSKNVESRRGKHQRVKLFN